MVLIALTFVFFFKQKTAYEMRISDWSSDVCSSDLLETLLLAAQWHPLAVRDDHAVDLGKREGGELALRRLGQRVLVLEVADHQDVLVVQAVCRVGVVEAAAGDRKSVV